MPASSSSSAELNPSDLADLLRPALLRVSRKLRQQAQQDGLSPLDAMLLALIKRNPGIGISDLADEEQISRPTMSAHLKRLEAAGLVSRNADALDARRCGFAVTRAGARRFDAVRRRRNDWLGARLARLTPEDRQRLADAVAPLAQLLNDPQ